MFAIPKEIMEGPGVQLFDHIAKCLADFVHDREIQEEELPLGFKQAPQRPQYKLQFKGVGGMA